MVGQLKNQRIKNQRRKRLFWGLFVVSIVFHGAVFNLPWPRPSLSSASRLSDNDEHLDADQPVAISAVSLSDLDPPLEKSEKRTAGEVLARAPEDAPQPQDTAAPLSAQPIQVQPAQPPVPQPVQILVQSPVEQSPVLPTFTQPPANFAESASPSESPSTQIPEEGIPEEGIPSSTASIDTDPTQGMVMRLGKGFPDLAGAQSGCYGLVGCRQLSGNYRQAARQLIAQMEARGYRLTERSDVDGAGHRVFEAIAPDQPDKTYYLNIFSPDVGSAVYVMAADILSLEELQKLSS